MSAFTSTRKGFGLIFRRPAIPVAEIAWRSSVAVAAWLLCGAFLFGYASTLPVDALDRLLLGTQQPALILRALQRIFHGSGLRFTESGILVVVLIAFAWIVLGSLGRTATVMAMVAEWCLFSPVASWRESVWSIMGLNLLRVASTLTAIVAAAGAGFIASGLWASTHLSVAGAVRLWLLLLFLSWLAWAILNWVLATASLFVVGTGRNGFAAVAATARWCMERIGSVVAAGIWFRVAHTAAFIVLCVVEFTLIGLKDDLGAVPVLFLSVFVFAAYCVVADALYVGRLAAYLWLSREDELSERIRGDAPPVPPAGFAVDQNELILSDIPVPAS
ncbi:MAG TPA: hypothetical protein VJO35_14030 [Terriglobales bacterium]|nr:hypothetical protein [Terriglobales bacterium]